MPSTAEANHLSFLRRAAGLTQIQLALRAGVGRATVEQIEAGRTPRRSTQERLARVFGLSPEDVFPTHTKSSFQKKVSPQSKLCSSSRPPALILPHLKNRSSVESEATT